MKSYTFFQDGGHGWLKVKKSELVALGIADKITPFSFQYKEWAYLEEDCDLGVFFDAKGWKGTAEFWKSGTIKNAYSQTHSKIRSYAPYDCRPYVKPKIGDIVELLSCQIKSATWIAPRQIRTIDGRIYRVTPSLIGSKLEAFI